MSRQIDMSKPDEWTEEDLDYLRQRPELVPVSERHRLNDTPLAPAQAAESLELTRLRDFLNENFADEMKATEVGDTPVGIAIRLLSDEYETVPADEADDGVATTDYTKWTVAELKAEVDSRNTDPNRTTEIVPASDRKNDLAAALTADDAAS